MSTAVWLGKAFATTIEGLWRVLAVCACGTDVDSVVVCRCQARNFCRGASSVAYSYVTAYTCLQHLTVSKSRPGWTGDLQDSNTLIRHYSTLLLFRSPMLGNPRQHESIREVRCGTRSSPHSCLSMVPDPSHRIEYPVQAHRTPFCNPNTCNQHVAPVAELCSPTQQKYQKSLALGDAPTRSNVASTTVGSFWRLDSLVEKQWLSDVLYLRNGALEVECLGEDDLEDLLALAAVSRSGAV